MRIVRPLRDRAVAALWAGLATSAIGDQLYAVALSWIAVSVFGAAAGYLTAFQAVVVLVTAIFCGRWADRRRHQTVMIAADLARAMVLILLVTIWVTFGRPPAWGLVLAVLVLAAGQVFFRPALQATLPNLIVDRAMLPATNALLDSTERIARLLGPGIVALLAGLLPLMHFLTLDAATFVISATAVMLVGRLGRLVRSPLPARDGTLAGMTRGFRAMSRHPLLAYILLSSGVLNGAWYAAMFLGLPLAIDTLGIAGPGGTGLGAFGLVIACYGSTNLLATLVVGSRELPSRPARMMCSGNMTVGLGILLLGVVIASPLPSIALLPGLMAAAALAAIGGPMSDITIATLRQTLLPVNDIAAAMRAYMIVANVGLLAAMLAAPPLLNRCGTAPVVVACGLLILVVGLGGLLRLNRVGTSHHPSMSEVSLS
jgi:hypothetical protein